MKNRRKKPGVKLTRAQKKKLEELTRQAKADGRHPSSAQKTIPYLSMYKDGLCRVTENYYTMSLLFDDMNYDLEDEAEQLGIFGGWCSFYSYFDCAVHVQMTGINSENDPEAFARALAVLERNEAYRALCAEYVQLLQTQYMRSNNGQTRIKLMTFGIESESVKGARSRLMRIGLDMQGNFKKIGVESVLMDGKERLSLLHALFHMDDHTPFVFEWSWLPETGLSTKDFIAPGSFDFSPSRSFKIGETYCAASYIQIQTSSLSKKLLGELLRLPSSAVFSLHVQPMDQMTAIKLIKQKQVVLDATKISEQQKAFRSGYDIDIIPRDIDAYGDDTKRLLQTLGTNEKLYMATIVVMNMAGSKRQLDQAVAQTRGILQTRSCALIPLDFQQEKGLTACLPLGINPLKIERCMPTSAVAGFIPFSTQELCRLDGKPVYYGVNRVSGCVIMADRTVNRNPNGLIFGTSGSGKSVSGKQEMIYIYLTTDDQIILCDPEGEYRVLTRRLNGQTIMLSADSHDYINPMDIELEENMDDVLRLKSELILSFCEIVMDGKRNIPAEANSVIDRCLPIIYEKYIKDPKPENMPTLGDLYECLKRQPEPQVRRIVTALELYVTGSLNYFNHDPYALCAIISAYLGGEEWTIDSAYPVMERYFKLQYVLTEKITTETRYRTEQRVGQQLVTDPKTGAQRWESYTYEVEVPYTYRICDVKLENKNLSHQPVYSMSREKMGLYALYMSTLGNMPDLFAGKPHASQLKDPLLYDVSEEYKQADPQFGKLIEEAEKYLGFPYVWGGSSPDTSFDCSDFVSYVFTNSGVYNTGRLGATGLYGICQKITADEARPGDLIFFEGTMGEDVGGITHVGLYVGGDMMIHCGNPITYADLTRSYWQQHFYGFGRIPYDP